MDYLKLSFEVYINIRVIITGKFNPYFIKINENLFYLLGKSQATGKERYIFVFIITAQKNEQNFSAHRCLWNIIKGIQEPGCYSPFNETERAGLLLSFLCQSIIRFISGIKDIFAGLAELLSICQPWSSRILAFQRQT